MSKQHRSCETCKHDLGGDVCRYGWELECADDEYQLWEPDDPIPGKPIAEEIEELYGRVDYNRG